MSEERRNGNGGSGGDSRMTSSTASEGVITYKRRKHSLADSGSDLQGDTGVSSRGQAVEELHGTLKCNGVHEDGGLARIQHHWRIMLEQLLLSQCMSDNGIWNCIQKALVSGNFSFTNKSSADAAKAKYTCEGNGNFNVESKRVSNFQKARNKHKDIALDELQRDTSGHADVCVISKKCQNILIEVLVSEKFALLCDLLLGNFPGIKADNIIDLSLINSNMKNGAYGQSIGLLDQDLQQVWDRIQKIGQEMALLATSLSNISQASCQWQGEEDLGVSMVELDYQKASGVGAEEKNSMDSHTTMHIPYESDRSTKPEQTEASCLYKVPIRKECGAEADGKCSLICDGCEAMYHLSCVMPALEGISTQNWYCSVCTRDKRKSAEPNITNTCQDGLHQICVVSDGLEVSGMIEQPTRDSGENAVVDESRESSVSSMDSEGIPQPSKTAMLELCKLCGTHEDIDKRFIICNHSLCLYKYYHIRCLKSSQMAIQQQSRQRGCWYCPSCLCRACLIDKDDDMIILCDGCDEAYHTYCMKPPCTTIPKGKWYCVPCNILRAKRGVKNYEQWVPQQHKRSDENLSSGSNRSMDLLLSAAEKMERLAAVRNNG